MSDAPTPFVPSVPESGQPGQPVVPAVPPVPPVEGTPAPRYGEFAPVESAPVGSADVGSTPVGSAPAAPAPVAAAAGQPAMYSGTAAPVAPQAGYPQQGYTQGYAQQGYAQGYPQQAQPGYPQPGYAQAGPVYGQPGFGSTPGPKRRTWDVVLTIILLVLGLGGTLLGVLYGIIFSSPELIDDAFRQQGLGGFDGEVGATPLVLIVSHVVLYLVAAGLSILLLVKKKIAFYIPLIAGVVAAVIFWAALIMLMLSDPDFAGTYGR